MTESPISFELMKLLIPAPLKNSSRIKIKSEQQMCIQFANHLRSLTLEKDFPYVWFHIGNEFSSYNAVYGILMSWMGRIAGVPDYCFLSGKDSFFIEFKSEKGKMSVKQKFFERWANSKGLFIYEFRTCKEAIEFVERKAEEFKNIV